jgi:putative ABC transport system permease protein
VTRHLLKLVWRRKGANALIIVEIFFSFLVVFLVATAAVTLLAAWHRPLGYEWHDVRVIDINHGSQSMPQETADDPNREPLARMLAEVKSFAEVEDAALDETPAFSNSTSSGNWDLNGRRVELTMDNVTDSFAGVMRMKVLRGRWFAPTDDALSYKPVVVDTDLARAVFGDVDAVGKLLDNPGGKQLRVIGVIAPYRKDGELAPGRTNMAFFRKSLRIANGSMPDTLVVRLRPGTPAQFEETLAKRLHAIAPDATIRTRSMERMRTLGLRLRLGPLVAGGIIALFLITMVALGLTGVLWQTVTRRRREIGLRRALGATGGGVRAQVLAEVALLSTLAVGLGVIVVLQLPLLGALNIVSVGVFATGVAAALAMIYALTLLCGAYPSWLASTVEPAEALRYE